MFVFSAHMGNIVRMKPNISGASTSSTTQNWGPGQVVDPAMSSTSQNTSSAENTTPSRNKLNNWQWKEHHTLPKWGGQRCMDLAATGLLVYQRC